MRITPFPSCCGAYVICELGYTSCTVGDKIGLPKEDIKLRLKHWIKIYKGNAFLITILNEEQKQVIGQVFLDCGFKEVSQGYSLGHHHTLTTYIHSLG